jgi:hypothetical protein
VSAPVTRRHRELALAAVFDVNADELARSKNSAIRWAETGDDDSIPWTDWLPRVAQALADIEAESIADREHLEEGARLLYAMTNGDEVVESDIDVWIETEEERRKASR